MTRIVCKTPDFLIAYKPAGTPTQADKSGDTDALSHLRAQLLALGECGEIYLVHRLDRVVGGLLVFARNKKSAAALSTLVSDGELCKEYLAVVEGVADAGVMIDYLTKDSTLGKARVSPLETPKSKRAELEYATLETVEYRGKPLSLVKIKLHTGRFHQIRAQFSSRGMPLFADKKYGGKSRGQFPALFAYHLSVDLPKLSVDEYLMPSYDEIPWSLFKAENYRISE